jgi:hypothetical protein
MLGIVHTGPVEMRSTDLALLLAGVDIADTSATLVRTRSVSGGGRFE